MDDFSIKILGSSYHSRFHFFNRDGKMERIRIFMIKTIEICYCFPLAR